MAPVDNRIISRSRTSKMRRVFSRSDNATSRFDKNCPMSDVDDMNMSRSQPAMMSRTLSRSDNVISPCENGSDDILMSRSQTMNIGRALSRSDNEISSSYNSSNSPVAVDDTIMPRSQTLKMGHALSRTDNVISRLRNNEGELSEENQISDMELMKERFAKLLLGEDMSGGGNGVSSALALSNAITNLAASVFSEQRKLEPMPADRKARWKKEIDWLLSVTDYIVELVPSRQTSKDGSQMEVMVTRQRNDLRMNVPALRKLDAMLIECLDNFIDQNEFYYASRNDVQKGENQRNDDKWWLPTPKVPPNGLSEITRNWIQFQKESVNQVLKAAMAINAQVLAEMEIPENYIESLPKNGRASLGESIYRSITDEFFDPCYFLSTMDFSSEHKILDLKNRIEASVVIWKRKMNDKNGKHAWGSAVSLEKREQLEERAEIVLLMLKHQFPGIPQSALEISKIQYNQDVGKAILEACSRVIESLASTVLSRIEEVLNADDQARNPSLGQEKKILSRDFSQVWGSGSLPNAQAEIEKLNAAETPASMTLWNFMGWTLDNQDAEEDLKEDLTKDVDSMNLSKLPNNATSKNFSYMENLGSLRSPTASD